MSFCLRIVLVLVMIGLPCCGGQGRSSTDRDGSDSAATDLTEAGQSTSTVSESGMSSTASGATLTTTSSGDEQPQREVREQEAIDPEIIRVDEPVEDPELGSVEKGQACLVAPVSVPCQSDQGDLSYYDLRAGSCERYEPGECGTNENTFESASACQSTCGAPESCGCLDTPETCDPTRCDLCLEEHAFPGEEACSMVGLICRLPDVGQCDCSIDVAGHATWLCRYTGR